MVPTLNESRVVRRISGQTTDGSDDILVDDRGRWWRALPHSEADATAPAGMQGTVTRDGRIVW